jgi:hypothetical protein
VQGAESVTPPNMLSKYDPVVLKGAFDTSAFPSSFPESRGRPWNVFLAIGFLL